MLPTVLVPWMVLMSKHSMRIGAAGRPSAVASSSSAPRVRPWSASQRACSRASVSAAFRPASARSALPSPRCGTVRATLLPRRSRRKASSSSASDSARGTRIRGGTEPGRGVVLAHEGGQRLLVGPVPEVLQLEHVPADGLAVADGEQLHGGLVARPREAQDVQLAAREAGHLLRLHRPLDGAHLVPERRGAFVLHRVRRGGHLPLDGPRDLLLAPVEEQHHLVDVRAVRRLVDGLDAGALAALDVVQQAGPGEGPLALVDVDGAGPEREQPTDEVHRLVHARRGRVRTEVATAVGGQLAGALDAREVVAQGHLDERVALVILEPDVEAWLVPLDQVRLEQQRLADGVGERPVQVHHPVDGGLDAQRWCRAGPALLPVLADAVLEALRLAHVQHATLGILHEVHARAIGQALEGGRDLRGHRSLMVGRARVSG